MSKRPNIIIINPDEMRWDTMGHMGNPAANTPFLDQLAETEAVSFTHAYCQNPVCTPSRCSFATGLYPHVRGHRTMLHLLHEDEPSIFSELRDAGYYVWMNARNDLVAGQIKGLTDRHASEIHYYDKNAPVERVDIAKTGGMPMGGMGRPKKEDPYPYSFYGGLIENAKADSDMTDTLAACNRILNPVDPDKPLCLFIGWMNPHPTYQVDEPYFSAIDRSKVPPRIRFEDTTGKCRMLHRMRELTGLTDFPEETWNESRAIYLAQCMKVDAMFKMICDALKQAGEYDNSAIFFFSDHGDFAGDYGLPEKVQNSFEDVLSRVPMLVKPPKGYPIDPGKSDSLVELVDFYATAMEYAGVEPSHTHFGRSLQPALADRSIPVRQYVHCEGGRLAGETHCDEWHGSGPNGPQKSNPYWAKQTAMYDDDAHEKATMIFDGRYKYVHRLYGAHELYDLERDPQELTNVYGKIELAAETLRLQTELLDWYQQTCDIVPYRYDSRWAPERMFVRFRQFCPAEYEDQLLAYVREGHTDFGSIQTYIQHLKEQSNN